MVIRKSSNVQGHRREFRLIHHRRRGRTNRGVPMRRPAWIIRDGLLLSLTGVALFFGAGCEFDPILNHYVVPYVTGAEVFNVCVPGTSFGPWTRYTVAVLPNGGLSH